jgi:iron complex outermembrane receptor protein
LLAAGSVVFGAACAKAQEVLPTIDVNNTNTAPLQQTPQLGKTGTKIEDMPASVHVIQGETVREQGGTDLKASIRNVSGVSEGGPSSYGFFDRFLIRGLDARIYEDGFSDGDQINGVPHSLNGVDHIEVLKGPGSALFGSGPPGGSINIVHFTPSSAPAYGITTQGGSFGTASTNFFATGPTTIEGTNYRVDGLAAHSDGFRDNKANDFELRPQWERKTLDHVTNVTFDLRHIQLTPDPQGIVYFRNAPNTIAYPISSVPNTTKYSSPYNNAVQDFARLMVTDTWTVNNILTVNNRLSYLHRDLDILRNGDGGTLVGTSLTARTARHQHDLDDDLTYQFEPVWKFNTGEIGHSLLTGFEARKQWVLTHREQTPTCDKDPVGCVPDIPNVFNPVIPDQNIGGLNFAAQFNDKLRATYSSFYATDQIDVTDKFKVRAGVREDIWNQNLTPSFSRTDGPTTLVGGTTYGRTDTPLSWNVGALYHVLPGVSPYVGYAVGHLINFNSEATQNGLHAPEDSKQIEAGVKLQAWEDRITLTTAWFDTQRNNVQGTLTTGGVTTIVFSNQHTTGVEADLELKPIDRWKILANMTIQNAVLTDNPSVPTATGNIPQGVPRHLYNLWSTYDFKIGNIDGFRVGAGLRGRDTIFADAANTFAVPGYLVGDAMVGYTQDKWELAFYVKNITNKTYFVTANGSGGYVGDARSYFGKVTCKF